MQALEGLTIINGTDIWKAFGAFLTEESEGGRENIKAIMTPAKAKSHVGVNIRETDGVRYSTALDTRSEERDVTLHFALVAPTATEWLRRYRAFIRFLKEGDGGWLTVTFPQIGLSMRMFYVDCPGYEPLTDIWSGKLQGSRFRIRFREPVPSF